MKVNIFRHKSKDGYLLLAVEWPDDVAADLQHLLTLNLSVQDVSIESTNILSFKIVSNKDAKFTKTNIVNVVRTYLSSKELLDTQGSPVEEMPYEEPEMILVPKNQFQFIITESAEIRINNAVLCEEKRGAIEYLKLLQGILMVLFSGFCLFGAVAFVLSLILLGIL